MGERTTKAERELARLVGGLGNILHHHGVDSPIAQDIVKLLRDEYHVAKPGDDREQAHQGSD